MKKRIHKTLTGGLMAAAMALTSFSSVIPMAANADEEEVKGETVLEMNFDESPIILPWHTVESLPASQHFRVDDGRLMVGVDQNIGSDSRFDLQTRVRGLPLTTGHKYRISCKISANADGSIYSRIGDYSGSEDFWNSLGGQEWTPLKVEKGKEYDISDTFTVTKSVNSPCEWSFAYADNLGMFNIEDHGMPTGSVIYFDDLKIEDLSGGNYIEYNDNEYGIIRPKSNVRINQIGYYTKLAKQASYCTDNSEPCEFELRDSDGKTVYTGKASKVVMDGFAGIIKDDEARDIHKNSGKYVQILDFSDFAKPGKYTIFVKDEVGVSGTAWYKKEGAFDTKAEEDKLMWTNWVTHKSYCMNESAVFEVSDDIYTNQFIDDSLNYFYQNRTGIDIEDKYISSDDAKEQDSKYKLSHNATLKSDEAYVQKQWIKFYNFEKFDGDKDYQIDVTGGWTDADSHCKSVTNGGFAVWTLQNTFELAKSMGTADKFIDKLHVPENDNSYPDILDEARYELEWMMKMMVAEDDPYFGKDAKDMVYHKVQDHKWLGLAYKPWDYIGYTDVTRIVKPPTYAATLNLSACAAQAARLWKDYDPEFAEKCLDVAKRTYAAVKAKTGWKTLYGECRDDMLFAPNDQAIGGEAYGDSYVQDELYWAGCELFAATGDKEYYEDLSSYKNENDRSANDKAFSIRAYGIDNYIDGNCAFNYNSTSGLGTLTLALNSDKLEVKDIESITGSIIGCAEDYIMFMHNSANGMGISIPPTNFTEYGGIGPDIEFCEYGYLPNGSVINNALLMSYAYSLTGDKQFLNGAAESMDYILGRNGLDYSYVTGYGTDAVKNPHHIYWANQVDADFPTAPSGVLVGGPHFKPYSDKYMGALGLNANTEAVQRIYADYIEAFSANICGVELNAPLVAVASFVQDAANGNIVTSSFPSTTTVTTTIQTTTTVTSASVPAKTYGDVNCDDEVSMSDAVLIMQTLANPDKYGLKGTDEHHITEQGLANADCCNTGDGMTNKDALSIQKFMLKFIDKLPDKW